MLEHHRRMLAFDHWANLESLAAVERAAAAAPKALAWMAHVAAAKRLWFARVMATPPPLPIWPTLSVDECRRQLIAAHDEWMAYLTSLGDADVDRDVVYTNTRGERFASPLTDILCHLPLHGQHHRGQAAAAVRDGGATPAVIDFIHASRQGYV
jgi:uncharacterized damage-inducible protein DinB